MKTIGIIGGMSWESTVTYYELINKEVIRHLGGFHSAKILMYSVDFAELEVVLPESKDMEFVNDVIFNELCLGKVLDSSRDEYKRIIEDMKEKGAEGVILGCTEIGMLIKDEDSALPTYDTTIIHATAAADLALG